MFTYPLPNLGLRFVKVEHFGSGPSWGGSDNDRRKKKVFQWHDLGAAHGKM